MRIVMVWIVAITIIFSISIGWWISIPVIAGVSQGLNSSITDARGRSAQTAIEYMAYAWGPVFIGFVLLWAVINSQRYDLESSVYG